MFEFKNNNMDIKEIDFEILFLVWFVVGLLDGIWVGGKVMVMVDVIFLMLKIYLVYLFVEKIVK